MRPIPTTLLCLIGALVLSGCSLPRGAAISSEILRGEKNGNPTIDIVPVSRANLADLDRWPATGDHIGHRWIGGGDGNASAMVRPGDLVNLVIWESEENSLLAPTGQKTAALPQMTVSPNGSIFVPYLDEVPISGMTPAEVRRKLQELLAPIIPSAQVQLSVEPGRQNTVDLVSGVANPGSFPLPDRNFSILSLLAQGGGIDPKLRNPVVRLIRGSSTYEIRADRLFSDGSANTILRGGDKVLVEEDRRYFTALGATGQQELVYFTQDRITALETISMAGGLAESRANPRGVLVLRDYPAAAVRADGTGPALPQVVFTFDLTSADGLFAARSFRIYPQDTVLVTESPVNAARTVLGMIGSVVGISNAVSN